MTAEEIRKEIELLQNVANNIKVSVGCLRSDINQLEGAIKQDNDEFEARLAEAESRGFQKGYEKGFSEGKLRKDLSEMQDSVIRVGDEILIDRERAIVTKVEPMSDGSVGISFVYSNGAVCWNYDTNAKRTGRHFAQVKELLEAMRP